MKTTNQTSDRLTPNSPAPHWSRVRPALRWTLAASVTAGLGLIGEGAVRIIGSQEFPETAARLIAQNAPTVINMLAVLSVAAVWVERARTTGGLRKWRRRLVRSMRVTQRLMHGSRAA